jgi:hypothetical protein
MAGVGMLTSVEWNKWMHLMEALEADATLGGYSAYVPAVTCVVSGCAALNCKAAGDQSMDLPLQPWRQQPDSLRSQ